MATKIINKKMLEIIQKEEPMGIGEESNCYFLKGTSDIIKIYFQPKRLNNIKFADKKSLYIAFPKDILVDVETNAVVANTMSYFPGEKIINGFPTDLEVAKLKEAYTILQEEIRQFSDIYMVDLCLDNILYDLKSNCFYIIDTGRWYKLPDVSALNQARIDINLSSALYNSGLSWLKDYPNLKEENPKLYDFFITSKDVRYCPFLEFLDTLILELETKYSQEVKTIGDLIPKTFKKS